ncbi:class I SAM-dependent methyltransferase [Candidatus Poriferisocius sp.]|uniref:class I SAM-dependent methyltransferase n=1 Tax=Candidatus Poriferisocius sp. TaxID=3101276 RepID=UPI003B01060B
MTENAPKQSLSTTEVAKYNTAAWDKSAATGGIWSTPVTPEDVECARQGEVRIKLTPSKIVPAEWFPALSGLEVLALASGGGQQVPLMAAAGANVTLVDLSEGQLDVDRMVAKREGLSINTVKADISDLSMFEPDSFEFILHPISNLFIADIEPVWEEAFRVLRPGGTLVSGFNNPAIYIFDWRDHERGALTVRHQLPFADAVDLDPEERDSFIEDGITLEYSHTLEQQIGGQINAGFEIIGFYEDRHDELALAHYMSTSIVTRARKPQLDITN